jgi:hypothetical protein
LQPSRSTPFSPKFFAKQGKSICGLKPSWVFTLISSLKAGATDGVINCPGLQAGATDGVYQLLQPSGWRNRWGLSIAPVFRLEKQVEFINCPGLQAGDNYGIDPSRHLS